MASFFVSESGDLLDVAKRAALDAVAGYSLLNPYTVGVAVQAAAQVLRTGDQLGVEPSGEARPSRDVIDVGAVEVTPRLRALESVAQAALETHAGLHDGASCRLCAALDDLEDLDAAG